MLRFCFVCLMGLSLLACNLPLSAQEWQEVPEDKRRLEDANSAKVDKAAAEASKYFVKNGVYAKGRGSIDGAFGLPFDKPISKKHIKHLDGWTFAPALPGTLVYIGAIKPFDMMTYQLAPPAIPKLLQSSRTRYHAYIDFSGYPLWIRAERVPDIATVIAVLKRKYGTPDRELTKVVEFRRGDAHLEVLINGSIGTLNYYHNSRFQVYLKERNRRLRKKFNDHDRLKLNPREKYIMSLADQMVSIRQDLSQAFGLGFGHRVGFKAKPDEYVTFTPSKPLEGMGGGVYKIMVSPALIPVGIRYEKTGTTEALLEQKHLLDKALEIAFGGFLKRTDKHSVLSLKNMTLSLIVRQQKFLFTVIDSAQNKAFNKRMASRKQAAKDARALAERKKEIEAETGF